MARTLTDMQELFVEAYCGKANLDPRKAAELAGYTLARDTHKRLMTNEKIKGAIEKRLELNKRRSWLTEDKILETLWKEATREGKGSSHAARINALVTLGKHIGMFTEKKEDAGPQKIEYKIVNYNSAVPVKQIEAAVEEHKEEVLEHLEDPEPIEGLKITNYSEEE